MPRDAGGTYTLPAGNPVVTATTITVNWANTTLADISAALTASLSVDGSVTAAKLASNSVTTVKILDSNVTASKLASDSVTTAKILDANVTTAKIADGNVTAVKVASDSVTTVKILDANVTTAKIADLNVTTAKIADANVTTAKIADLNVTTGKVADGAITAIKLASDSVTFAKIVDEAVTNSKLGPNSVTDDKILNATINAAAKLVNGSVTSTQLGSNSVTTVKITDANVTTAKIADANVTYAKIQNVSATDRLLGRSTAGAGVVEEIVCTSFARTILDDTTAAAVATTIGLGTTSDPTFDTLTLTSGQILFPAVQVDNAGANVLDDYEEGTWTPVLTFSTPGDLAVTYSLQTGVYTKVGRLVSLEARITTSSWTHTTASGILRVTGTPFNGQTASQTAVAFYQITLDTDYTGISVPPPTTGSGSVINLSQFGSGKVSTLVDVTNAPTATTPQLYLMMTYSAT